MRKDYIPSLANSFLQTSESAARTGFSVKPLLYRCFHDIFLIWLGFRHQLADFEIFLNSLMPGIKVTLCTGVTRHDGRQSSSQRYSLCAPYTCLQTNQLLFTSSCSFRPKHSKGILK